MPHKRICERVWFACYPRGLSCLHRHKDRNVQCQFRPTCTKWMEETQAFVWSLWQMYMPDLHWMVCFLTMKLKKTSLAPVTVATTSTPLLLLPCPKKTDEKCSGILLYIGKKKKTHKKIAKTKSTGVKRQNLLALTEMDMAESNLNLRAKCWSGNLTRVADSLNFCYELIPMEKLSSRLSSL